MELGSYLPKKIYTNEYLETLVPTNAKWVENLLGIKERRIIAENQATSDLAYEAGKKAIADSGLQEEDIDLIVVATSTPDRIAPSTAAITQHKLQAYNAVTFDISAVCSSFLPSILLVAFLIMFL